ncbi:MAG: hypothetical protein JO040_06140 [Gemmatimonadetes bacterium]|nr:hypothetical protein [Gemmatimonadota bacterium]
MRHRLVLFGAAVGAVAALLNGLVELGCAPRPGIVLVVAGAFGAGASFTAALQSYLTARQGSRRT